MAAGVALIDSQGYRYNIALPLLNHKQQLFWGKRALDNGWQFAQGGMDKGETEEQTLERELLEELGLRMDEVRVLGCSSDWYRYEVPKKLFKRRFMKGNFIGQRQRWYLLQLLADDDRIAFNRTKEWPEFTSWHWVNYWYPLHAIVDFKRAVYQKALSELAPLAFQLDGDTLRTPEVL